MKHRSLIVFTGDPPEDSSSVLLDLCLWELCFSLVSPLWELCYSLALCWGMRPERAVHFVCRFLYFLFFFLFLSFLFSSFLPHLILLFFFFPFAQTLSIPFFFFSSFPPLYSSSHIFHLFAFLRFIFISFSFPLSFLRALFFFFFLRKLLVLCTSEVYWMTLMIVIVLIVIECNLTEIKREFSFLTMNFYILLYAIFPSIICLRCLKRLIKYPVSAQIVILKLTMLHLRLQTEVY